MVATALAALPVVGLVMFSSLDRYGADRARAESRAINRAELIAVLLAESDSAQPPSHTRLSQLLVLGADTPDTAAVVYRGNRAVARAGSPGAGPPTTDRKVDAALGQGATVFLATGPDGVKRVWGLTRIGRGPLSVAYGLPGSAVYGSARSALVRDLVLAALCVLVVLLASFMLAGRITAPIRRVAAEMAGDAGSGTDDLGAIERGVVQIANDRRKLEEQLRQAHKMEAVGQLAGGIAHDFNNLLTVISGYSELAQMKLGPGPGASELGEIDRAAERAAQLTRQLLTFARQQVLEPTALDLSEITRALAPMLHRLIGEDIHVVMRLADDLPPILADRAQVEQVVVNLAINARDAMPTGGTVTLETRALDLDEHYAREHLVKAQGYVCLTVTDTGTGIPAERLEHIFEPFFTTKGAGQGTGLGLATVHGVVTQSGGHVQVYSETGYGTTFKVYFPAAVGAVADAPIDEPAPIRLTGTETILLCEDEDAVRGLLVLLLTDAGYEVLAACRPTEALELAQSHDGRIAALVTDVILPDMPGPELAERLVALRAGLPTLFLSGYSGDTLRDRGNLPPDSAFLEKPFDRDTLLRQMRALLDASPLPAAPAA